MCGILGFISNSHPDKSTSEARHMLSQIRHRGPDDDGIVSTPEVTFGFARLSIMDTTLGSHQPMWSDDKKVCIVFNGEIYNFRELRAELEQVGKVFKTTGDTEVIVKAYEVFGEECFKKLGGMFAIAIYDFSKKKLILARDRLGKKPLFYYKNKDAFIFASELKALSAHSLFKKELDLDSVNLYFAHDYIPTPKTIYKNTHKLEPGSYLVFEKGETRIHKFWTLDPAPYEGSFQKAKHKLDHLIDHSVKKRLVSDVPLGVFLSGGLDSSTVAYYAQKHSSQKIKTFSISFDEKSFDESDYAREAARHIGSEHHEKKVTEKELLEVFGSLGRLVDEPMGDASIIPTYLLSKFTKEKVTVALGGDGADELFAGYPTFQAAQFYSLYRKLPKFIRHLFKKVVYLVPISHSNFSLGFKLRKFLDAAGESEAHAHAEWLGSFTKKDRLNLFLSKQEQRVKGGDEFASIDSHYKEGKNMSPKNKVLYTYLRGYLMDEVMVKVDRASMYASLEARSPLLDHELVEFAYSLPYSWKFRKFTTKYILKHLMKNKLPHSIVFRQKKGFGMPIGRWFQHELRDFVDKTLSKKHIEKGGLFNYSYIEKLKSEHFSGKADHRKKLWNLLVFELWREENKV